MKISSLRLVKTPGGARALATVSWEDSPLPPFDLFFETDDRAAEDLAPEPEAFLTACLVPAAHRGERRILVEGSLCPKLADGAVGALDLLRSWYGSPPSVAIEATRGLRPLYPRSPARAAFFFTGGVDSLHLLATNRAQYPRDHPASFADGISVFGHLCADTDESPWYDGALPALAEAAALAQMSLTPIRTNLWRLEPDLDLFTTKSLSAGLVGAAHLFRRRWSRVSIATGRHVSGEVLRGTHPLLDPLYSTTAIEIRHDGARSTRFERLREVAGSTPGVESLIVCLAYPPPPHLNCGRCEKCVRTMTSLLTLGKLADARHFPFREVRPEMIDAISIKPVEAAYWEEILPSVAGVARADLVDAIQRKLEETRRVELWLADAGWKGALRRLDRRFLGGRLAALRGRLAPRH